MPTKGLMDRLRDGETVVCAEGYHFILERRGYFRFGSSVPLIVLEHPEVVRQQYEEFVHAGSDVVLALTYYANRAKMSIIDRVEDIEKLNRDAARMAREVADKTGSLMAGNICNTNEYIPDNPDNDIKLKDMFKEQMLWAVEEGADFIVAETFSDFGEAKLALETCKECAKGLPVVVTMAWHQREINGQPATLDGVTLEDTFQRLEAAGADVLGLNCARGPETMLPLMERIKKLNLKVPLAALPVAYRTTQKEPNFQSLKDPKTGKKLFFGNLDCAQSSREDIHDFGLRCKELGFQYVGVCCGNAPHYTRALCEALGRKPPASRYSIDMHDHYLFGTSEKLCKYSTEDMYQYIAGK